MIPPKTDPCWKDLVTGKNQHQFTLASLAMCVARNQRQTKVDPASLDRCIEDTYAFCNKFQKLVEDELASAFKLERV